MASTSNPSPATVRMIQRALACARSGDAAGTRAAAESGLRGAEALEVFRALLGGLDCQAGNYVAGIAHFRAALEIKPGDVAVRSNLVCALLDSSDVRGALEACSSAVAESDGSLRLLRLRAYLLQQTGADADSAAAYRRIVAAHPDDFESWNNMGNALAASGDAEAGLTAIDKAVALQPRNAPSRFNQASMTVQLGRDAEAEALFKACCADFPGDEKPRAELASLYKRQGRDAEALQLLEQAAQIAPFDPDLQLRLGTELQYSWQMENAEAAYRSAIALQPGHDQAHIALAMLLEHLNRSRDLAIAVRDAEAGNLRSGTVHFLKALLFRRESRFAEALGELQGVPPELEPIRAAQLRGQCNDRLGNVNEAFESFAEMNRLQQTDPSEPMRRAQEYREALSRDRALVTADWHGSWLSELPTASGRSPVFLLGFPRSGTTLLDTMLMGHPQVQVLEERPTIARVERELGGMAALADLSASDLARLREIYFDEARRWVEIRNDSLLVDKFPLYLNKVPIIRRLFPDARFVLALRHPLDVLLSCYTTNFRLNNAMANFLDLATAAWVYDQSFGFWEQSRQVFALDCCTVVYERMVENAAAELRPLCDYLGLEWVDNVLDHQRTASNRSVITTASYSQVTEPIYTRAKGRWERYRPWLEPVLPVIQPWIERHGYQA